jgi:acetylornithine deacetylase/succinyl-diaminopimelate desuccinylase-like protein
MSEANLLVRLMSKAVRAVTGRRPECLGIRGWTEAGNFAALSKVPAIIFGPGSMKAAHSENEWIQLEEVYQAAKILEVFLRGWRGQRY